MEIAENAWKTRPRRDTPGKLSQRAEPGSLELEGNGAIQEAVEDAALEILANLRENLQSARKLLVTIVSGEARGD